MSRLPQVTPRKMIAALQRAGFHVERVKGSHHFLLHNHDRTRWATVAVHPAICRREVCAIYSSKQKSHAKNF